MESRERVAAVIRGRIPDRVPVALHNFMMAVRLSGIPAPECLQRGELLAESQLVAWRRFRHDMLLVENGTTAMAQAFGCGVHYGDAVAPRVVEPVVKDLRKVSSLRVPDPHRDAPLPELLKAVGILRRELGGNAFICGRSDQAPLAEAAALRGYEQIYVDMVETPELLAPLLDKCLEATTRLALALKDAGSDSTCIGEFGSNNISPRAYRGQALPRLQRFFAAMRRASFTAALHQCGDTGAVLDDMVATGADVLELDACTDIGFVRCSTSGRVTVHGMVAPAHVVHLGTPELVEGKSRWAMDVLAPGGRFILGPGCAIAAETPEDNVTALVDSARRWGQYAPDGSLRR